LIERLLVCRAGGPFHRGKGLDSLTQGKLLPCPPPKKKPGIFRAFVFGGGENRTLVLSKLYKDDYMLSTLI